MDIHMSWHVLFGSKKFKTEIKKKKTRKGSVFIGLKSTKTPFDTEVQVFLKKN